MTRDNNNTPVISIVLPTYNRAYILGKAIESVLAQTYADWELIIVDDGSVDNTEAVVQSYKDWRIRYVKHERNKGLAASRNTGIRESHGTYIANLDSDDVWLPTKLEKEMQKFQPGIDVVYSMYERTLANNTTVCLPPQSINPKEGDLRSVFLAGNIISMQMAIVRRDIFERYGMFDESIEALQDWELWLRLAPHCQFACVPEVLTVGSVQKDSIAKNKQKRLRGREAIFKKHEKLFKTVPAVYAQHAFSIGHAYALRSEAQRALPYLKKAFFTQPSHLKYIIGITLATTAWVLHKPAWYKYVVSYIILSKARLLT